MGQSSDSDADADPDAATGIRLTTPDLSRLDDLVDQWVALAEDQRRYDSHLLPAANRETVRTAMARHVVTDGVRVAVEEGSLRGFVMFGLEEGAYEQDVTRGVIRNLFVVPTHRNLGIGSRLLGTAEAALAEAGADVVSLEAMAGNRGAIRFYARRGYEPHRLELEKRVENDTHSKEDR